MDDIIVGLRPIATIMRGVDDASNLGPRITGYGFRVFTSDPVLAGDRHNDRQRALVWTNIVLTGLNIFGIWRWLGRRRGSKRGDSAARPASRLRASRCSRCRCFSRRRSRTGRGSFSAPAWMQWRAAAAAKLHYVVASKAVLPAWGDASPLAVEQRQCRLRQAHRVGRRFEGLRRSRRTMAGPLIVTAEPAPGLCLAQRLAPAPLSG
jgi:hypothetical protein